VRTRSHRSLHWQILVYVLLGVFALVYLAPFAIQLANSFKTDADASVNGLSPIPHPATLLAWDQIFGISNVWLFNSAFVSTVLTVSRVFLDSLAGYALARLDFRGRRIVFGLIVATASCCSSRAF
jgi:multiple sugar transport system permease protein